MKTSKFTDPFKEVRLDKGYSMLDDQGDPVMMILGHKDVRRCAHNWKTFQSGGDEVGRIVVPSEVHIRDTRQIPFELDPPQHKAYRSLVEPWFKRPLEADYQMALTKMIKTLVAEVLEKEHVEIVEDFALKLQSRALTLLLNIPFEEADLWISWGTHVFRSEETALDADKANVLYDYIDKAIDKAIEHPGEDLYSVLLNSVVNGKKLSKEEVKGVMILTFAGGRDTVINAITNTIAYFAEHPESLARLKTEPEILNTAIEELIRYYSPLTQMGRVVTEDTQVCPHMAKANSRISLVWAAANRDERVFEQANEVVLDRKINPHVAFGFGIHNCLGATHARQLLKILITELSESILKIRINNAEEHYEDLNEFKRQVGFNSLDVTFYKQ